MLIRWKIFYVLISLGSYFIFLNPAFAAGKGKPPTAGGIGYLELDIGSAYTFPQVMVGSQAEQSVILTNSGKKLASLISLSGLSAPFGFKGGSFPGVGGNCTQDLDNGASCILVFSFQPALPGAFNQLATISYFDGKADSTLEFQLSGTSPGPANLEANSTNIGFGSVESGEQAIAFSNSGESSASNILAGSLNAPFSYKGGAYPGTGGNCGSNLSPGAQCTVVVSFNPSGFGNFGQSVAFSYFDGLANRSITINLSGTRLTLANFVSSSTNIDFGSSGSGEQTLTLSNSGETAGSNILAGSLGAPFSFKGGAYPGTGGSCGNNLGSGSQCTVVFSFNATSFGSFSQSVVFSYFDGMVNRSMTINLAGTRLTLANLAASSTSINFGSSGSGDQTLSISNSGETSASSLSAGNLSVPFSYKGGTYPGTGGNCGSSLGAGAQCNLVLSFNPNSYGSFNQSLLFSYFDGSVNKNISINLSGTKLTPANLVTSSSNIDFGSSGSSEQALVLSNSGQTQITSLVMSGVVSPFSIVSGNCGSVIASGAFCSVLLGFNATSEGSFTGNLSVSYFDGTQSQTISLVLSGTKTPPPAPLGPLDVSFNQSGFKIDTLDGAVGRAIAVQTDGKILVAGYYVTGALSQFAVARFNSDGTLDAGFGNTGIAMTSLGATDARAYGVAVQSNGSIFVAGYAVKNGTKDVALAKFNSVGVLDLTFNSGKGYSTVDVAGADDVAYSVAIQSDGKIVLGGYSFLDIDDDFILVRFTTAGRLDSPFNGTGVTALDFGYGKDRGAALAIQADGKILLAGFSTSSNSTTNIGIARFTSTGSYDYSFGDGVTKEISDSSPSYGTGIKVQSNGSILVSGYGQVLGRNVFIVARLNAGGQLDNGFASSGVNRLSIDQQNAYAMGLALQSTGKVVVAGFAQLDSGVSKGTVAKLSATGSLDTSYGQNGMNQILLGNYNDTRIYGVAVQDDDKIICVGGVSDGANQKLSIMRLMP